MVPCPVSLEVYFVFDYIYLRSKFHCVFFFLMIRRPPRSTLDRSSAASDVYKRQDLTQKFEGVSVRPAILKDGCSQHPSVSTGHTRMPVSYTHLRAHETVLDLVCRLLLEQKTKSPKNYHKRTKIYSKTRQSTQQYHSTDTNANRLV